MNKRKETLYKNLDWALEDLKDIPDLINGLFCKNTSKSKFLVGICIYNKDIHIDKVIKFFSMFKEIKILLVARVLEFKVSKYELKIISNLDSNTNLVSEFMSSYNDKDFKGATISKVSYNSLQYEVMEKIEEILG